MDPTSETLLAWAQTALALLWTTTLALTLTALALGVLAVFYALAHLRRSRPRRPRAPRHVAPSLDLPRLDDARQRRRNRTIHSSDDEPA